MARPALAAVEAVMSQNADERTRSWWLDGPATTCCTSPLA